MQRNSAIELRVSHSFRCQERIARLTATPPKPISASRRREFADGVRAQVPLLLGVAPFGAAYGLSAADAGLPLGLAQAMSAIVFGGASQFVAVRLLVNGTPGAIIVLTTLLVNSRHALYSASLAPYTERLNRRWRWLLAYLLTDEAYATTVTRYQRGDEGPFRHWFFLGAAVALWICWQATTAGGVFVGKAVPASWSLDFALPLTFLAILMPAVRDKPAVAAALVAGIVAVVGFRWSYSTGLLTAMVAGMAAGMLADRVTGSAAEPDSPGTDGLP